MSLHQIEFFLSVAKHLNFTKAAHECNISQSAISQQIENFENALGFKLFDRNNRKTTLTKGGEVFLGHAQQILDAYNTAVFESSQAASSQSHRIRIGYSGPWEKFILPRIACAYNRIAPNVSLEFKFIPLNFLSASLFENKIDFAFAAPYCLEPLDKLEILNLYDSPINVVVSKNHRLANNESVTTMEIGRENLILLNSASSTGLQKRAAHLMKKLNLQAADKQIILQDDLDSVILLVQSEMGITLLPKAIKQSLAPNDLQFIDIQHVEENFSVGVAWINSDSTKNQCMLDFIGFLQTHALDPGEASATLHKPDRTKKPKAGRYDPRT